MDWRGIPAGMTAEQRWLKFLGIVHRVQDGYVPQRKLFSNGRARQPPVKYCVKAKERAYTVAKVSGKLDDWKAFKIQ